MKTLIVLAVVLSVITPSIGCCESPSLASPTNMTSPLNPLSPLSPLYPAYQPSHSGADDAQAEKPLSPEETKRQANLQFWCLGVPLLVMMIGILLGMRFGWFNN